MYLCWFISFEFCLNVSQIARKKGKKYKIKPDPLGCKAVVEKKGKTEKL